MKTRIILLSVYIFYAVHFQAQEQKKFNYESFNAYFSDVKYNISKEDTVKYNQRIIPCNIFTEFLFQNQGISKIWGHTKIIYPNGYDLFILRELTDYSGTEEDFNKKIDSEVYLVFKDGKLVKDYYSQSMENVLSIGITNDGGFLLNQSYTINEDSTIIIDRTQSDCCSSTGFEEFINTKTKISYKLNNAGSLQIKDVLVLEFTSNLFDDKYLTNYKGNYPTEENKYNLTINNDIQDVPFFSDSISLWFYVESLNEKLSPKFTTIEKGICHLDSILIGSLPPNISYEEKISDPESINCPIIIRTPNIIYEVLPDGKFNPIRYEK
ncbi:hypothetical protein [Dysgonomonas sp. ZJ279]|uniref:hypothetical protein n=1 Tax=Dysgonomonas sp. ZJ279 TaxID=2709796 RepID=UPI0013EC581B|nr:hypothetical protein [Dysgonomonas sp. ZJ279]